MKSGKKSYRRSQNILVFFLGFSSFYPVCAQTSVNTVISGVVTDAKTKEPMPAVAVSLMNTTIGTLTDAQGKYSIITSSTSYKMKFNYLGYEDFTKVIIPGKKQVVNVELIPSSFQLNEVIVRPEKKVYRNKNNPAVELIDKVIHNKDLNRKENLDYFNYEKYEKVVFSLSNISEKLRDLGPLKKFQFIFENTDTTRQDGRKNLPLFIRESQSDYFYRKNPRATKEIIKAEKTINFDEYIDNKGVSANLNYLYQNINIYDNDIFFLTNKFLSPISSGAPVLYRYFIMDTSLVEGTKCIRMFFEPRNPADFLFHGFLFITDDPAMAIKKIDMSFNKGINIDWIKDVRIVQEFENIQGKAWILTKDEIMVDFGITEKLPGMFGERSVTYSKYSINEPVADSIFKGQMTVRKNDPAEKSDGYWVSVRKPPLNSYEKGIYTMVDSVKKIPGFRSRMNIIMLVTTEFLNLGKMEIGPAGSFYSYNPTEGSRIWFGGRTTPQFNKSLYFESFIAYGFKDRLPKYNLMATYSLSHTSIYTFPVKSFKIDYQYDTRIPGQLPEFSSGDNIFLSLKRGINDKILYNRTFKTEYLNELENHFSYTLGYSFTSQVPGGNLHFIPGDATQTEELKSINISEAYLRLRYAPNEEFYQGKIYRDPVPSRYPVIQIQYSFGSKFLNNNYNYNKIQLSISRRMYLSIVGYTDISLEAGKVFGTIPYPLLFIHNANQTYAYQKYSYNMMNFLEFVSDKYVSLNLDHSFNGFFFNKVPLLKKLKLREVATLKILYGGVGDDNNPSLNTSLFRYPEDINGNPLTYTLEKKPYIEASVGCSNIFRVLRVDIVKRFTYLNHPDVPSIGVRVKVKLDF